MVITRPDDWHLHLRDGVEMQAVLPHTAVRFARAVVMPNLRSPIVTTDMAIAYRARILDALVETTRSPQHFQPLMTLYLTDNTPSEEVVKAQQSGMVYGVKYYPAGATTNSDSGVTDIRKCDDVLETMQRINLPLLIHGEVTDPEIDVFDREQVFIDQILIPLTQRYPQLRIVLEHITTSDAVHFVEESTENIAASITVHHLMLNRNALFHGGLNPHHYCLPVLKREKHRHALLQAVISGNTKFFLGTDSAPHAQVYKETACGCAGIYTAHAAIELYAEVFEQANALDKLEAFASFHGADFYQLPRNQDTITLIKDSWTIPDYYALGEEKLIPLCASQQINWRIS